jgi:hypothetical protein
MPARHLRQGGSGLAAPLLLGLIAACAGCASSGERRAGGEVRYELSWDARGVTRPAGEAAWQVVNDLGYRVRVERGYLVARSMELVECGGSSERVAGLPSLVGAVLGPPPAYAGHGSMAPNPVAISTPHIESLLAAEHAEAGRVPLPNVAYCRVHYLVARADRSAVGLPADLDMLDKSVRVEGAYLAPGATEEVPFALATSIANGALVELFPPGRFAVAQDAFRLTGDVAGARVVIRRRLATLFDGIRLDEASTGDAARRLVENVIDDATVEVAVEGPS